MSVCGIHFVNDVNDPVFPFPDIQFVHEASKVRKKNHPSITYSFFFFDNEPHIGEWGCMQSLDVCKKKVYS